MRKTENMKEKIGLAYVQLIEKKDVDKITVKDIVTACGISRQTFYYHYQDVMDVNERVMQLYIDEALEKWLKTETPYEGICVFVDTVYAHKKVLMRLGDSKYILMMQRKLIRTVSSMLDAVFSQKFDTTSMEKGNYETFLDFVSWGIVGCTINGLVENEDKNALSARINRIFRTLSYSLTLL